MFPIGGDVVLPISVVKIHKSALAELLITMSDEVFYPQFTMTQYIANTLNGYITIHFTHDIYDVLNIRPKSTIIMLSD